MVKPSLLSIGFGALLTVIIVRTIWKGRNTIEPEPCGTNEDAIPVGDIQYGRLSRAIRIPTISMSVGDYNTSALTEFNTLLRKEYPNVFSSAFIKSEVVGNYSLLLSVAGQEPALMPYLLMSHMDVVPAESPEWLVKPFEGIVDDKFIWGRGAMDVKNTLLAIMEVVDVLAKSGKRPKRSFYVAFGHDEEVGGGDGAVRMAALLKQRGIRFKFVLDEGMPIVAETLAPGLAALIGVGEKGLLILKLSVNMTGGHSSTPRAESSISVLARAVTKLSQTPHPHHFGSGVEVAMLERLAFALPLPKRVLMTNLWFFGPIVAWIMAARGESAALLRTTTAVTILRGGFKFNVIPGYAEAVVNHRVHALDTLEDVLQRDRDIINDDRVRIELESAYHPPTPISSWTSFGFSVISKSVRQVFNNIPVAPGLCVGNTDSRHFDELSDDVYKFAPTIFEEGDTKRFHGPNERISKENYAQTVNFFHHVMKNADRSDGDTDINHSPADL